MSRHFDHSDPGTPTRVDSLSLTTALPVVAGVEVEPTDCPSLPRWLVKSHLFFVKQNHEKWGGRWEFAIECEYELARHGLLPLCYRRTE